MKKESGIENAVLHSANVLLCATVAALVISPLVAAQQDPAQTRHPEVDAPAPQPLPVVQERYLVNKFPDKPSVPPTWSIPLDPLGFTSPGAIYLGARNSLASLDFLDEDHLLFTFRVPGLLHRDTSNGEESDERQIRAIVLTLPLGAVAAEAQWTVHDRVRYLWALKNGHFLLRNRNNLLEGDATLKLKPLLDFPGNLLWLELDPEQKFLVTNSREPVAKLAESSSPADGSSSPGSNTGQVPSPGTASASMTEDSDFDSDDNSVPDFVVRILRRDSGDVLLVTRARTAVHLPINSVGYLENLRGRGEQWMLNLNFFTGGSRMLGSVDTNCQPIENFLSDEEIFVTGCGPGGESKLIAMTTAGRTLWASEAPSSEIWPQLAVASGGLRLAWETLDTDHPVNSFAPLGTEDIKEQSVTVFDAATGDIAMVSPVSPVLDAGGNVAVSPSGRRIALLDAGAIQVFELPAPPPLPAIPAKHSSH
ncbi:MAG: hypothetical protein ACLPZY_07450 [Terracidiphilus sp.]